MFLYYVPLLNSMKAQIEFLILYQTIAWLDCLPLGALPEAEESRHCVETEPLPEASATASSGQRPRARASGTLGCLHEGSCCGLDRRIPLSIRLSGGACLLEYQLLQDSICVLLCRPWSVATQRHVCLIVLGLPTLAQSYQSADCAV